ncbi:hypothetical protein FHS15_000238 [Paenibacillus castaneae]|uniref:hypothetical protein n=1 Tax=Paenibacillus castaneae TaxID=474957 RepID=UPI00141BAA28|nr:hypothetical protein [Paenibacillus castaneae]NIK75140.1 hypothetical protein [Paenibacillus castaneae]
MELRPFKALWGMEGTYAEQFRIRTSRLYTDRAFYQQACRRFMGSQSMDNGLYIE